MSTKTSSFIYHSTKKNLNYQNCCGIFKFSNELLGMVDVEPDLKIGLPTVEAIKANKIDKF